MAEPLRIEVNTARLFADKVYSEAVSQRELLERIADSVPLDNEPLHKQMIGIAELSTDVINASYKLKRALEDANEEVRRRYR